MEPVKVSKIMRCTHNVDTEGSYRGWHEIRLTGELPEGCDRDRLIARINAAIAAEAVNAASPPTPMVWTTQLCPPRFIPVFSAARGEELERRIARLEGQVSSEPQISADKPAQVYRCTKCAAQRLTIEQGSRCQCGNACWKIAP